MYREIENLLILSKKGDKEAKEKLLKKLKPLILSSIRRYYNKSSEYEDLIQEGYETVLRCIKDYDFQKDVPFLGFVKARLKYYYLNKHRQIQPLSLNGPIKYGEKGEIGHFIPDSRPYIEEIFEKEERLKLYESLNSLTEKQRSIIIDFYIHNLSLSQIAEKMGVAYRTVVNIKTAALKKLRSLIVK